MLCFDESLPVFVRTLVDALGARRLKDGVALRDTSGRLAFFCAEELGEAERDSAVAALRRQVGVYARKDRILCDIRAPGAESILGDPNARLFRVGEYWIRLLDRRVVGVWREAALCEAIHVPSVNRPRKTPCRRRSASHENPSGAQTVLCYRSPMARPKPRTPKSAPPESAALRVRQPSEVLAALVREQARLVKAIAKKQREIQSERERDQEQARTLSERLEPVRNELDALVIEITRLFHDLIAPGRLSPKARMQVLEVYDSLVESGDFAPLKNDPREHVEATDPDDPFASDADDDWLPPPNPHAHVSSAEHAGGKPGHDTLRGLFRRLTVALHPDLVPQGEEQLRRTEAMKEVTRAYEEGNLARLMELERQWLTGSPIASNADSDAERCAKLEKAIAELKRQQHALQAEMRAVRAQSPLSILFGRKRSSAADRARQVEEFVASAQGELSSLRIIRNHVQAFAAKKISLAKFVRGPKELVFDIDQLRETALRMVRNDVEFDGSAPSKRRGRSRRDATAPPADFDDCPF